MTDSEKKKIGKSGLAIALIIVGIFFIGGPYLLPYLGLAKSPKEGAWIILVLTYIGIVLKSSIGFLVTRVFRFDKFAYEECVLALGGFLSCASLQLTSNDDLFPGLEEISFFSFMSSVPVDIVTQHRFLLFLLFLIALIVTIFTGMNVSDSENKNFSSTWDFISTIFGTVLLAAYALALVAKG